MDHIILLSFSLKTTSLLPGQNTQKTHHFDQSQTTEAFLRTHFCHNSKNYWELKKSSSTN